MQPKRRLFLQGTGRGQKVRYDYRLLRGTSIDGGTSRVTALKSGSPKTKTLLC